MLRMIACTHPGAHAMVVALPLHILFHANFGITIAVDYSRFERGKETFQLGLRLTFVLCHLLDNLLLLIARALDKYWAELLSRSGVHRFDAPGPCFIIL